MTFTLIERQKLGPNAYRVNQWWDAGNDQDAAYQVLAEWRNGNADRYGPDGTHRLVLLGPELRERA